MRPQPPVTPFQCISSMATRQVLAELLSAYQQLSGVSVQLTSVGGVDAARRIADGEAFDLVVLASDAIERLMEAGHLVAGSRVDLVRSEVAVAIRDGAAVPDLHSEAAVREAVLAAPRIGYSTGPSGTALLERFRRWGIADALQERLVQARPGVPVASLIASGEVALGFQQLSELQGVSGIQVVGCLPPSVAIVTTFSAAYPRQPAVASSDALRGLVSFLASEEAEAVKRRHGMAPA
jgi:molybdate transport system substrate-binding protein